MIKAVIFDFDGVIGDTMNDNYLAWKHTFAQYNFNLAAADYFRMEGMGRYQIANEVIEANKLDISNVDELVAAKEEYYKNNNTFRVYDEVGAILALLKQKNIPVAVVTGASKARISEHLDPLIASQLTALVTADDVTHTKPHPEPYLKAVGALNIPAKDCLVIENAILGIQSAKAAGCICYALGTTLIKADLQTADEVFASHSELLRKLAEII